MSTLVKHVGRQGEKKCVIVFREVPNEPENCLVVQPETLESRHHDEFMQIVEGIEAQSAQSLADVLNRRQFSDGENMLSHLHYSGKIQKVPTVNVDLTPTPAQRVNLAEVNAAIRSQEMGNPPPKTDPSHQEDLEKPWIERTAEEATAMNQRNQAIDPAKVAEETVATLEPTADAAQGLVMQAELIKEDAAAMMRDAEAKLEEAYKLDPSLKPKKRGRPPGSGKKKA